MDYLTNIMKKVDEIAGTIYSALSNTPQYAFAGVSNYNLNNGENIGSRGESWLENACFSHDGIKKGVPRSKGNTRLHHASKVVEGINVNERKVGESLKAFLARTVGPSRAKQMLKHYK
jgi:hypothetical protein